MRETRKSIAFNDHSKPHIDLCNSRCNKHLLGLGQEIKASLQNANLISYQFGTVGVSDGISMGTRGMSYSLQSRDLIADAVETAAGGHHLDGMVVVPGCDKNMPGVLMARQYLSYLSSLSLIFFRRIFH
jgi:dihydroxyacid dehydratase/phosphogluconate dehydratase